MPGHVPDLIDDLRFGSVERTRKDRFSALDDDGKNGRGNEKPDDRVGKRVAQPYADRTDEHRKACPSVDAGVIAVGDQGGTADFASDANAEDRNGFVAEKADDRRSDHRPQVRYLLRVQEPLDALVSRDDGARENRQHDGNAGQVLDAPIAEGEAGARLLAGEPERDAERDRRRGIPQVVNRVGEEPDAPGNEHHNELNRRGDGEADERPLDRP